MSALFNCSTVVFGDRLSVDTMTSASSFESSNSSPDSSQEASAASLSSVRFQPVMNLEALIFNDSVNNSHTFLKVIEEPVEKFRFRYKSEMMGTHGSILARSSERNRRKIYPTVQLCNYNRPAIIRCSLYTAHPNEKLRTPHTHRLIVRAENNMDRDDPHETIVSQDNDYTAIFHGMGIIHTAKKNIVDELIKKKRSRLLEKLQVKNINIVNLNTVQDATLRQQAEEEARKMNLNSVSLCFEAFVRDSNNCLHQICEPVFSKPINNMKSALTGELKICRIDKNVSSCMGGEEVFILVEKVGKKNIKIKFFEVDDDDNEIWCDYGKFSELDVHHQYAIVFRTPPYRDLDIEKKVDVFLQLYRPTDGDRSEAIRFQYKPSDKIGRTRKRQRMCNESLQSGENFLNGLNGGVNGDLFFGLDLKNTTDCLIGTENISITELLDDGNDINSPEFQDLIKNISLQDLDEPRTQSGCGGSVGTENSKPVKFHMEPACTGAFILHPSGFPFAGGLKTEGINASDYFKTFDDPQDIVCDGEQNKTTHATATKTVMGKGQEDKVKANDESDHPVVKKETTGDVNLLQNAITQLNIVAREKLSSDHACKKNEEIFHIKNEDGETPLHAAVMTGQKDTLQFLLQTVSQTQNKDILNLRNNKLETPLHLAVLHNQPEFVKMLLSKGADVNSLNNDGNTPIHMSIRCGHDECLTELLDLSNYTNNDHKPQCDEANYEGQTPLHLSAMKNNLFAVKRLVESGANVNTVDTTLGRHVLLVAVQEGHKEIVEYLVKETNVDVNLANYAGNTPLHYACVVGGGNVEICKLLVNAKADPLKANHEQRSKAAELTLSAWCKTTDITIKEEIESEDELPLHIDYEDDDEDDDDQDDDENCDNEDDESSKKGQTSLDLARDKKEILEILKKADQFMAATFVNHEDVQVKEECPSSPSEHSTITDNGLFDEETLGKLCSILDTSKAWTNLADLLDYSFLVPSIKNATSPSKLLFNYADLHGNVTVQNIRNFLEALDEKGAVEVIDLMLARQVASDQEGR